MQPIFIMKKLGKGCLGVSERIISISIISYGKNSLDLWPTWVTTSPRERIDFVSQGPTVLASLCQYPWAGSGGIHVDREMRGTFTKLWAISWTIIIALYFRITVDGWRGILKYSKWGRFCDGGKRSAVQKFRKCTCSNVIRWKRSFYTVCARIMFSFLRSYIKKRRPKFFWRAESFSELISCLFLPSSLQVTVPQNLFIQTA
jgi:hypothetical protein